MFVFGFCFFGVHVCACVSVCVCVLLDGSEVTLSHFIRQWPVFWALSGCRGELCIQRLSGGEDSVKGNGKVRKK